MDIKNINLQNFRSEPFFYEKRKMFEKKTETPPSSSEKISKTEDLRKLIDEIPNFSQKNTNIFELSKNILDKASLEELTNKEKEKAETIIQKTKEDINNLATEENLKKLQKTDSQAFLYAVARALTQTKNIFEAILALKIILPAKIKERIDKKEYKKEYKKAVAKALKTHREKRKKLQIEIVSKQADDLYNKIIKKLGNREELKISPYKFVKRKKNGIQILKKGKEILFIAKTEENKNTEKLEEKLEEMAKIKASIDKNEKQEKLRSAEQARLDSIPAEQLEKNEAIKTLREKARNLTPDQISENLDTIAPLGEIRFFTLNEKNEPIDIRAKIKEAVIARYKNHSEIKTLPETVFNKLVSFLGIKIEENLPEEAYSSQFEVTVDYPHVKYEKVTFAYHIKKAVKGWVSSLKEYTLSKIQGGAGALVAKAGFFGGMIGPWLNQNILMPLANFLEKITGSAPVQKSKKIVNEKIEKWSKYFAEIRREEEVKTFKETYNKLKKEFKNLKLKIPSVLDLRIWAASLVKGSSSSKNPETLIAKVKKDLKDNPFALALYQEILKNKGLAFSKETWEILKKCHVGKNTDSVETRVKKFKEVFDRENIPASKFIAKIDSGEITFT